MADTLKGHKQSRGFHPVWVVALLAFLMAIPTIGGGFVGGDDHRLALNHVLVNHPSLEHAVKIFTTTHRDLYQPVPLLTFQIEFAIADFFGLFNERLAGGAWLFHLNNALLHMINAVLVWFVVAGLQERVTRAKAPMHAQSNSAAKGAFFGHCAIATVAAVIFAVHPLQAEVIAWLNGRMMLLSTLFALGAVLAMIRWLDKPRIGMACIVVLLVALCGLSKVRVAVPVLLGIVVLARRATIDRKVVGLWLVCTGLTGLFVLVNVQATMEASLFSQGAEHLRGPRAVRVLAALAFYFQHFLWPAGLCSYYPTPPKVSWTDAGVLGAGVKVAIAFALLAWSARRSLVGRFGVLWFFAAIAVTLPIIPARNILAADRYMYLPMVGLAWMVAASLVRWVGPLIVSRGRAIVIVPSVLVVGAMVATGWRVGSSYNDPISKTLRIATLFPDTPRVWEPLGWSYLSEGQIEPAIKCARMELRHTDAPKVMCGGYQLLGMATLRGGDEEEGLRILQQAIETDPKNPRAKYRLGKAFVELDRVAEALPYFEASAELTPLHNPTLNHLASAYHQVGRRSEAREVYARSLENSEGYDVTAIMGLSTLDIESDVPERLVGAALRLGELLEWMPENLDARTNLGVILQRQGRSSDAEAAYAEVLRRSPDHLTALMNLAQLYHARGASKQADPLFERALHDVALTIDQAKTIHDFFVAIGRADGAAMMWSELAIRFPKSRDVRAFRAWASVLAGDSSQLDQATWPDDAESGRAALLTAAKAYSDFMARRYPAAMKVVNLLQGDAAGVVDARSRLLGALQRFDETESGIAWTYALAAQLLVFDGNKEGAVVFTDLCEQHCKEASCKAAVSDLRTQLPSQP